MDVKVSSFNAPLIPEIYFSILLKKPPTTGINKLLIGTFIVEVIVVFVGQAPNDI